MAVIPQDVKRAEMAEMLRIIADEMPRAGHRKDLLDIVDGLKRGNIDPTKTGIGCQSDMGSLVAGCVGRILKTEW